jgi:branched-chain amino acid transport system ATP-binding protein
VSGNGRSRPEPSDGAPILELARVSAGYGRFRVLFDVSLQVAEGSKLAVVGPNGAGKTTLARVCSALVRPSSGSVRFAGRDIAGLSPNDLARAGLVHVPEGRAVFGSLSVEENLVLPFRQEMSRPAVSAALDETYVAFPRLRERRRQLAGTLSGGEQRLLSLARVLTRPPKLLIADEPTLGLDPGMVQEVQQVLARVTGTLMVIEQRVERVAGVTEQVVTMRHGRLEAT